MSNRRQDLLNQLEAGANKPPPPVPVDFYSPLFQIMYGLPTELQLRAAVHMGERYLPIHETKVKSHRRLCTAALPRSRMKQPACVRSTVTRR